MSKQLKIYGIQPVLELIESGKQIDTIYLQKNIQTTSVERIKELVKKYKINLKIVPKFKLNRLTAKNHQGVIAISSTIIFQNFENLLELIFRNGEFPLFILLDRITDVRNFGSICRSAEAMGVHGVIIPEKGSAQINEIAVKASSGAISNINICRESNLIDTILLAKKSGLSIVGCSEKSNNDIFSINLKKPILIVIGSEENGISKSILKLCDEKGKIPTCGKTSSLNASVAAGIVLFECNRQKSIN
tara:strand:+ start:1029 stop:1769 length:741 start_codon:yes stop_codon:yes gene_type:complete